MDYVATENFIETHSKGTSSSPWRNLLLDALRAKAFLNGEQQCLLDTPGKPLPWFLDVKGALLEATALEAWSQAFWDRFCDKLHFQVGGLEVGAIPLLSAILMKAAQQIGGVQSGQPSGALADRAAGGFNDYRVTHEVRLEHVSLL